MKNKLKISLNKILFPIVMLLSGILMIIFRSNMFNIALYIVGALFIVSGIITLVKKEFIPGVINLVIGIVIILLGSILLNIAILTIGILLLVVGVVNLVNLIINKKNEILSYVAPIIMLLIGGLLVFGNFYSFVDIILLCAGICLIIYAVYQLLLILTYKRN